MDQVDTRRRSNSCCYSLCAHKDFNLSIWHHEPLKKMHISNHKHIALLVKEGFRKN